MVDDNLHVLDAAQQSKIHQLMLVARKVWLADALKDAMADVEPAVLRSQISTFVPVEAQHILGVVGIREEKMFPVPVVLEAKPSLVAYYRLLLGISQKRFYTTETGMGPFKKLEEGSPLTPELRSELPAFCSAMCLALSDLVSQVDLSLEPRDIEDLQLLTLGSYYYGSLNNAIGSAATLGVFTAVAEIVEPYIISRTKKTLGLSMPGDREIYIVVSGDPDIRIVDVTSEVEVPIVSIEIKGGTDSRNAYNRGGEAEKSHQGAIERGFNQCWTIINTANIDMTKLMRGSPTTTSWFNANEVIKQDGQDWRRFQSAVKNAIGFPDQL